jgi:Na+/proline symporter
MGVILGSGVVPIALCITWSRANKWGCIGGSIAGFFAGLIAWLVTTSALNGGVINVTTSGGDYEMLAGNLASIGVGGIIAVATSLIVSVSLSLVDLAELTAMHSGQKILILNQLGY